MADYLRRQVNRFPVIEYSLRLPTNMVEIEKLLAGLRQDLSAVKVYDDTVQVWATDDEIVFSYEKDVIARG